MNEVRGASLAEHPVGTRRPRRVEPHGDELTAIHARRAAGEFEALGNLADADVRSLDAAGRMLAQPRNQKQATLIEKGVVDRGPTEIDPGDNLFRWRHPFGSCWRCVISFQFQPQPVPRSPA